MPYNYDDLSALIDKLYYDFTYFLNYLYITCDRLETAGQYFQDGDMGWGGNDLAAAGTQLRYGLDLWGHGFQYAINGIYDTFYYINDNWGGDVTWQSIIDAWQFNDYEGDTLTIYVLDKMRERIWNRPFVLTSYENPPPP
jgi:hypothetical protein